MGTIEMNGVFRAKNKTAAQWTSENPILRDGEFGHEKDTHKSKVGDGVTTWNNLPYESAGGASPAAETITIPLGTPDTSTFTRTDNAALLLTKTNASLILEFFVTGNGAAQSRAVWRNKLTAEAISWLNSVNNYGYNAGVSISTFGATGLASKTLSMCVLSIKASSNNIELYMEGVGTGATYPLPYSFRTVCSLNNQ